MPDIYPYGRDAPEGTYFAERRGGFDRGGGGPGEEWDPGSANNSATASAAAELARMWASANVGIEPDATNYPGKFSAFHYATIAQDLIADAFPPGIGTNGYVLTADDTQPSGVKWASNLSVTWGFISGTLTDQSDLVAALAAKANASHTHNPDTDLTSVAITAGWLLAADGSGGVQWQAPPNSAVWGSIVGTLSSQTDLQSALDGKSATTHTHNGIKFTYSATEPVSRTVGDRWFDSTSGIEYTWVDDGDSTQWVQLDANGVVSLGAGGVNATIQYNNGGFLAGSTDFTWDATTKLLRAVGLWTMNAAVPPALSSIIHPAGSPWIYIGNSLVGSSGDNLRFYSNCYYNASHAVIAPGTSSGGLAQFAGGTWEFYGFPSGSAGRTPTLVLGMRIGYDTVSIDCGQLRYPVTAIPSSDPNTLDDYEEGTFTPGITFGGAAVGMTFSTQVGKYTKVGNLVTFSARITLTAKGSSTGAAKLSNMPFTAAGDPRGTAHIAYWFGMASTTDGLSVGADTGSSAFSIYFGGPAQASGATDANFTNTSDLILSGQYWI